MKYSHSSTEYLLDATQPGDKIIKTSAGNFKIRKNGKIVLTIDVGKENEERVRATPIYV